MVEGNSGPGTSPPPSDLAAAERCGNEITRPSSGVSAKAVDHQNDLLGPNANAGLARSTAWTNKKHDMYLNFLEASFVKQLHHSFGFLALESEDKTLDQQPLNCNDSSDQFSVLQEGSWQKINFRRHQPLLRRAADSHATKMESPWLHHFRFSNKCNLKLSPDFRGNSTFCSERTPLGRKRFFSRNLATSDSHHVGDHCHQEAVGIRAEVSDQNFVDETQEGKSSFLPPRKRLKMAATNASTKDQIVPTGVFLKTEITTACNPSLEGEGPVQHGWLSKNLEGFVCPEDDVKSFLRDS